MTGGKQKISFEKAMEKLETIVKKMESGKLSLEESLELFKEGIDLTTVCRELLAEAEFKVKHLLKNEEEGGRDVDDNKDLPVEGSSYDGDSDDTYRYEE
ncbi:MAG: exodeoxyribonuclease VII small subunit [Firmicutes bacterium]|mgnify:CR=1 FL=1|jgi:exodeoxyribonuclease VII small subunit|nr:exodeoxyribonuclease VII small subunit [Bacillota bacterium]